MVTDECDEDEGANSNFDSRVEDLASRTEEVESAQSEAQGRQRPSGVA